MRDIIGGRGKCTEVVIAHGVGEHGCDIARRGVHVALPAVEIKAMGVGELAVHAQFLGLFVHGIDKDTIGVVGRRVDNRADRARNRHAGVIARGDEKCPQCRLECHGVALFEVR